MRSSFVQTCFQISVSAAACIPSPRRNICSRRFIPNISALQIFSVLRVGKLCALIPQIAIPVRVKVQKHAARFQDAHPLSVGFFRIMQVPCNISRDQYIKGRRLKGKLFRVHLLKVNMLCQRTGIVPRFFQHRRCIVYRCDLIAELCQNDREKARPGANIQHPDFLRASIRESCSNSAGDYTAPDCFLVRGKFFLIDCGITGGAVRPVVDIFFLIGCKLFHGIILSRAALCFPCPNAEHRRVRQIQRSKDSLPDCCI